MDEKIMELVDRLIATSNRATLAEAKLEDITAKLVSTKEELEAAKEKIAVLEDEIKSDKRTISYSWTERERLDKELKELKAKYEEVSE